MRDGGGKEAIIWHRCCKKGLRWYPGSSHTGPKALLAAFSAGVKMAIIDRAGECVTLCYRETSPGSFRLLQAGPTNANASQNHRRVSRHAGGEMLRVRAGDAGAGQTQLARCPASLPGAQPLQDQPRAKGRQKHFKGNSSSRTGQAPSAPLSAPIGARRCRAHKRQKAALGPSQLVLIFAFGKAN